MPRAIPENRFKELLECATRVFVAYGYRRAQMADVSQALGVAKGTLYLYVESKEALFAAALHYADSEAPSPSELELPLAAPEPGSLAEELREILCREVAPAALTQGLEAQRVPDVRAELEGILRGLFATASRHRTAIKLILRCGADLSGLDAIFYREGRFAQVELLARYLDSRIRTGKLKAVPDVAAAARFVIESIATWAVHIHWDPAPQPIDPNDAEETVVQFLLGGLLRHKE